MSYLVRFFVWFLALFNAKVVTDSSGIRPNGWTFKILGTFKPWRRGSFSRGAGYINGWTFFIGRNCSIKVDSGNCSNVMRRRFVMGFTTNGNHTPWLEH